MLERQRRIIEIADDRLRQSDRLGGRHHSPGNAIVHQFGIAADAGGNYRNRARHRFENGVGNSLPARWQHEAVERRA